MERHPGGNAAAATAPALPARLPRIIASSVIRSTHQGESHGGVYLVDLRTGSAELMLDWDDPAINWEGRGADRGMRGIAFAGDSIYLAASDEIFQYGSDFSMIASFRNPYLRHCHEIVISGDRLYATSTGFDSVLELDLETGEFVRGHCVRYPRWALLVRKWGLWRFAKRLGIRPRPRLRVFDPRRPGGPGRGDTVHLNNVHVEGTAIYCSGADLGLLLRFEDATMHVAARIPYGTHNARPYGEGSILLNHTPSDRVCVVDLRGRVLESFEIPVYAAEELENSDLDARTARQAFGRGLVPVADGWLVAGSSPATVSLYRHGDTRPVRSVTLTRDVRNAIHGLERWPFDDLDAGG